MAFYFYVKDATSVGWSGVTAWAASTAYTVGQIRRQNAAPTEGNQRCFICVVAGTSGGSEPTWNLTKGASTTDNTVTWRECTGEAALNNANARTPVWGDLSNNPGLGTIIKNTADTHYFMCTTDGAKSTEPTWNTTAGNTTTSGSATFTCLGAKGSFTTNWAAPFARIATALSIAARRISSDGVDVLLFSDAHNPSFSTVLDYQCSASNVNPSQAICVQDGSPATGSTGGKETCTASGTVSFYDHGYFYGLTLDVGSGGNNTSITFGTTTGGLYFDNCTFKLNNTGTSSRFNTGSSSASNGNVNDFINCSFIFGSTSQKWLIRSNSANNFWGGSMAATGTAPSTLFDSASNGHTSQTRIVGMDLSGVTGTLASLGGASNARMRLEGCRIGSGVTPMSAEPTFNQQFFMHNCDSSTARYRLYSRARNGTLTTDTATVLSGGATDGATGISWKIVGQSGSASGNLARVPHPFESEEVVRYNSTTGSAITATFELCGPNTLTDADVWVVAEYLSNASYPIVSRVSSRKATLIASDSNLTTSSVTWSGSPAVKQKMSVTFTPQMAGPVRYRFYFAKQSGTVYIDPKPTMS